MLDPLTPPDEIIARDEQERQSARRGEIGATVTLAPSIHLVRLLQPVMGRLVRSAIGRTLLFSCRVVDAYILLHDAEGDVATTATRCNQQSRSTGGYVG